MKYYYVKGLYWKWILYQKNNDLYYLYRIHPKNLQIIKVPMQVSLGKHKYNIIKEYKTFNEVLIDFPEIILL